MRSLLLELALGLLVASALGCESYSSKVKSEAKNPEFEAAGKNLVDKPGPDLPLPRKIIYTAEVRLIVEDLQKGAQELKHLIKELKGYVAQSELSGSAGSPRQGHWKIRVPVEGFEAFLDEVVKLGVPQKNKTDSEDVTDKYYDLEARIKNKKAAEEGLRKLLEKTSGNVKDNLEVQREVEKLREDIDVNEGQLRRLANLTTLSTVDVTMQEIKDYVPPQTPSFGSDIASTFSGSIDWLAALGKGLVLVVVALIPWLPVLAVIGVPVWMLVRRRVRHPSGQPVPVLPADVPPPAPSSG